MCNCIEEMSEQIKQYNMGVVFNLFGPARACVETYKLDEKKRGKPPHLFASFCPFCGEKYADTSKAAEPAAVDPAQAAE